MQEEERRRGGVGEEGGFYLIKVTVSLHVYNIGFYFKLQINIHTYIHVY